MNMVNQLKKDDFIPSRLIEAREYCMLSGEDLANLVGVTRQAIFQYEKKTATPKPATVHNISQITSFPYEFFYTPNQSISIDKDIVLYRGTKAKTEKLKKSYAYTVKWADELKSILGKYINWFENNLPQGIDFDFENPDYQEIERISQEVRNHWGLGESPIDDICGILENNGIVICGMPEKDNSVEAYSEWFNGTPYIFYGGKRNSAAGFNFSIAHELGHLLLHQSARPANKADYDELEKQANYFAGAFLMPQSSFSKTYISSSLDSFISLKRKWSASIGSMIFRSYNLELISENQKGYLFKQLAWKGYKTKEPLDDTIVFKNPSILFNSISLLIDANLLDLDSVLSLLPIGIRKIQSICSIPDEFLEDIKPKRAAPQLRII